MKKLNKLLLICFLLLGGILLLQAGTISTSQDFKLTANKTSNNLRGNPDILVTPVKGPSVKTLLVQRAKTSWPWYITRTAGFIAALALFFLILSGVGLISGYTFKILEPLTAWATHKAIGLVFIVSVAIHGIALLFDKYVPFNVAQILFPFLSNYRRVVLFNHNVGSLYVALGILAMYGVLAIGLSTFFWIDKKPHTWKTIHFLAYLIAIFVFFHALYLGTDLMHGIFRTLWIIMGIIMAFAIIYRFRKVRSL